MPITLISASFLGLLLVYLSYNVSKERGRTKTSLGTGDDEGLLHAVRAQGNLIEYAPLGLILLGMLETLPINQTFLMVLAALLVVGRYSHGLTLGKFEGKNIFRMWGTIFTWLSILIASGTGLYEGVIAFM
ncbi:MAG: MAPEG family protein [Kordiimonadaceae bacterium]|nr:MAPEG family protein [Kordiimonadaceae bacterium]